MNMRYKHDFLFYCSTDEEGKDSFVDAPRLTDIERQLTEAGIPEQFSGYLHFETVLWNLHEKRLKAIDADRSFVDDDDGPACWKRDWEKYQAEMDHREAITYHRNALTQKARSIATSTYKRETQQ